VNESIAGNFAAAMIKRTKASGMQTTNPSKPHKTGRMDETPFTGIGPVYLSSTAFHLRTE
jgi:hypothetical protein